MFSLGKDVTIRGPLQKATDPPLVIWPLPIEEDGSTYFQLNNTAEWLCRFLTGTRAKMRPLGRHDFLEVIDQALKGLVTVSMPVVNSSKRKKIKLQQQKNALAAKPTLVQVCTHPGSTESTTLKVFRRKGRVYAELTDETLQWLYTYCSHGPTKGKRVTESKSREASQNEVSCRLGVTYSRTESCYICRGPLSLKRFRVRQTDASGQLLGAALFKQMLSSQRQAANAEMERQKIVDAGDGVPTEIVDAGDGVPTEIVDAGDGVPTASATSAHSCSEPSNSQRAGSDVSAAASESLDMDPFA